MTAVKKGDPVITISELRRDFRGVHALRGVSLSVAAGEIRALLGPNGAGKTTLLRVLTGLVAPTSGFVSVAGVDPSNRLRLQEAIGFVPASDRSLYLRISARENLLFFGRLQGYSKAAAGAHADRVLDAVGLSEAASRPLFTFSHGMVKRLAVARALLTSPQALLVDEATHDLDPEAARTVRELVAELAARGTAVIWTTQRVEEVRGFADSVTVIADGEVRFTGSVPSLLARAAPQSFLLTAHNGGVEGEALAHVMRRALGERASVRTSQGPTSFTLTLADDGTLGDAIGALNAAGVTVTGCRDERPELEQAFILLTAEPQ